MRMSLISFALVFLCAGAKAYDPYIDCATADVRIRVVDDKGEIVPEAMVSVVFFVAPERTKVYKGQSDNTGCFRAVGDCNGEAVAVVRKDGYYTTKTSIAVANVDRQSVLNTRRWSDATVGADVVLKKMHDPIRAIRHWDAWRRLSFPATNAVVGFDVAVNDWCKPHGKGVYDDFQLKYSVRGTASDPYNCSARLELSMTNRLDGFYFVKVDDSSVFKYRHAADTNAEYRKHALWQSGRQDVVDGFQQCPEKHFLVFRTRTSMNEKGELTSARYGYIGENVGYFGGLSIQMVLNPAENDPRLEDFYVVEWQQRKDRIRSRRQKTQKH